MLIVFLGGGVGSVLRYLTSAVTGKYYNGSFPLATLLVNVTGCLIIGAVTGLYLKNNMTNPDTRLLLVAGFCGGFTTFSAFAQENINLIQMNQFGMAVLYTVMSVLAGLAFVWIGLRITN